MRSHVLRPRILIYILLLSALSLGLVYSITQRIPLELDIIRDRNSLYRETTEGLVENVYNLKIINMDDQAHRYQLAVQGLDGLQLIMQQPFIDAMPGEVLSLPVSVRVDPVVLKITANEIEFVLSAQDNTRLSRTETARFLGPVLSR